MYMSSITSCVARHAYRKANSVANWVTTYMANHSGFALLEASSTLPRRFRDIIVIDVRGHIHARAL